MLATMSALHDKACDFSRGLFTFFVRSSSWMATLPTKDAPLLPVAKGIPLPFPRTERS